MSVIEEMRERLVELVKGKEGALAQANAFNGAVDEMTMWIKRLEEEAKANVPEEPGTGS